jgi:hypothetical protein
VKYVEEGKQSACQLKTKLKINIKALLKDGLVGIRYPQSKMLPNGTLVTLHNLPLKYASCPKNNRMKVVL